MRAIRTGHALSPRIIAFEPAVAVDGVRPSSTEAPFALRLKVFVTRGRLDRQLAAGHAHEATAELTLRAKHGGRPAICELAEQLERAAAVNPRGIILAQTLLTDGNSPLFNLDSGRRVTEAIREVQSVLA